MKNHLLRTCAAALLAFATVLSMTACGGDDDEPEPQPPAPAKKGSVTDRVETGRTAR